MDVLVQWHFCHVIKFHQSSFGSPMLLKYLQYYLHFCTIMYYTCLTHIVYASCTP